MRLSFQCQVTPTGGALVYGMYVERFQDLITTTDQLG